MKILVIEDELELRNSLETYLKGEGYIIELSDSLNSARQKVAIYQYDLLILDISLGDGNGLTLLSEMENQLGETGVIILSAKDSLDDKVQGLNLGADDYLTKPFHFPELKARINSVFRRRNQAGRKTISFQQVQIHTEEKVVTVDNQPVELTKKEYALLLFLGTNPGRVITKPEIAEHLWGDYADSFDNFDFIYTHVKNLRKKITDAGGTLTIKSVYGLGYKLLIS